MIPKSAHVTSHWSQANASAQMKLSTTLNLVEIKLKSASADVYLRHFMVAFFPRNAWRICETTA